MKKKKKVGRFTHLNFKTYYETAVIKTSWYQRKKRHRDQWGKTENPEMNPTGIGSLTGVPFSEKRVISSASAVETTGYMSAKRQNNPITIK